MAAQAPATVNLVQNEDLARDTQPMALVRKICTFIGLPGRVVIGAVLAVAFGVICRETGATDEMFVEAVALPGRLWLRLLRMVVLPLIFANVVEAVASLKSAAGGGRLGLSITAYYTLTTILAVCEGLAFSSAILIPNVDVIEESSLPGDVVESYDESELATRDVWEQFVAIFEGFTPSNIVASAASGDFLGVMSFAIMFGLAIPAPSDGKKSVILQFLHELGLVMFNIIHVIIIFTPLGVFSLASERLIIFDIADIVENVGIFLGAVFAGLAFHNIVVYPLLYLAFTRKNPLPYFRGIVPAMLTALGTSSSAATLPVTMQCAIERNKVPPTMAQLVLSLGATVNLDGTSIGFPMAVIFLATAQGITLSFGQLVTTGVVSALCSFAAAPIPSAGLVLLTTILEAADVPMTSLFGLIIAVDWIYDRPETMTNVVGDSVAAGIMAHLFGDGEGCGEKSADVETCVDMDKQQAPVLHTGDLTPSFAGEPPLSGADAADCNSLSN